MIKAVIIDDEQDSIEAMEQLLEIVNVEVKILGVATNAEDGRALIEKQNPEIVFLDIEMPGGNGFEMLDKIEKKDFETIFITAYNQFALKAFDYCAYNYLLKPVLVNDLEKVLQRYVEHTNVKNNKDRYKQLQKAFNNEFDKIMLPVNNELKLVDLDHILWIEAAGSYTIFHLKNHANIVVSKSIGHYEKTLQEANFVRVHNKNIVNLQHVKNYIRGDGGTIELENGVLVKVSVRKKPEFLLKLKHYTS